MAGLVLTLFLLGDLVRHCTLGKKSLYDRCSGDCCQRGCCKFTAGNGKEHRASNTAQGDDNASTLADHITTEYCLGLLARYLKLLVSRLNISGLRIGLEFASMVRLFNSKVDKALCRPRHQSIIPLKHLGGWSWPFKDLMLLKLDRWARKPLATHGAF